MDDVFEDGLLVDFTENGQPGVASPPTQGLQPLVDVPGDLTIPELEIAEGNPPPATPGVIQTLASLALESDDLPNPIDPNLSSDNVYLIFKPHDKKRLEFSLYTRDAFQYHRHDPVVNGESTRVPPGLIMTDNLEADTVYGVGRYLKMFGLALENKHAVPKPTEARQTPFAVRITNANREVHDRLTLARFCGLQISKPLFWNWPERKRKVTYQPFGANIGFVEWAMLPYNQTNDIKTLLSVWEQKGPKPFPSISATILDRHQAFVFNIGMSKLAASYGVSGVEVVTTIVPVAGKARKKRKPDKPAEMPGDGGTSFTDDRPPLAARTTPLPPPSQEDQRNLQAFDDLLQEFTYDGAGPGS